MWQYEKIKYLCHWSTNEKRKIGVEKYTEEIMVKTSSIWENPTFKDSDPAKGKKVKENHPYTYSYQTAKSQRLMR